MADILFSFKFFIIGIIDIWIQAKENLFCIQPLFWTRIMTELEFLSYIVKVFPWFKEK